MDRQFWIEQVALHLVDRHRASVAECSPITWDDYAADEQVEIAGYLDAHLGRAWLAEEELSTRRATFLAGSSVQQAYHDFALTGADFHGHSVKLAEALFEVTPEGTATPGALLTVWFHVSGHLPGPFLGLLKLDVDEAYVLYLRDHGPAPALKKLAVEHIHDALPGAGRRLLKWAITPHPSQDGVDLKLRDEQSPADFAGYFRDFLGCTLGATVAEGFTTEVKEESDKADAERGKARDRDDLPDLVQTVAERERGRDELAEKLHVVYKLTSGITISGPTAKIAKVKITGDPTQGYTFTAKANDFTTAYVLR